MNEAIFKYYIKENHVVKKCGVRYQELIKMLELHNKKDKKGKFGRVLGEMYVGDKNINLMMVDDHMAVEYKGQNKKEIEEEHIVNRNVLIEKGKFDPETVEKE